MSEQRKTLKLGEAAALTPPVNPVEAMRRQLAMALFDGVKEDDVLQLATKLKEMALGGDLKAMKMFFDLVVGKEPKAAPPPPSDGAGLKLMALALQDLVDEIRIAKAAPPASRQKALANGAHDDGED
jgi:hypothetical protein